MSLPIKWAPNIYASPSMDSRLKSPSIPTPSISSPKKRASSVVSQKNRKAPNKRKSVISSEVEMKPSSIIKVFVDLII